MSRPTVEQVARALAAHSRCEYWPSHMSTWTCSIPGIHEGADNETARNDHLARAVLALFEPRTVTTAAELDALPQSTVILDANGEAVERCGHIETQDGRFSAWCALLLPSLRQSNEVELPATVLHVPTEGETR
ncbi:hypothetical protein GCM10025865_01010 [Paraoerskovia sediminicola]|uniref:Uncharacterized protein n=1 Tax=Paraoerskovia sediminicola TaxID=1138587 RepID=A0ABN6XAW7_9CELL|nr:hypothetical protein [Paraoerskovia sediminicola]BDZ40802.1 hypothetical protein GCM10025865_01010 [Paraoerskovia sediminicola]